MTLFAWSWHPLTMYSWKALELDTLWQCPAGKLWNLTPSDSVQLESSGTWHPLTVSSWKALEPDTLWQCPAGKLWNLTPWQCPSGKLWSGSQSPINRRNMINEPGQLCLLGRPDSAWFLSIHDVCHKKTDLKVFVVVIPYGMTPTFREYDLWSQKTKILKSRCHTKRRMGAATRAHPSFGMTTTKTLTVSACTSSIPPAALDAAWKKTNHNVCSFVPLELLH